MATNTRLRRAIVAAGLLIPFVGFPGQASEVQALRCGSVITADATLTTDLPLCSGDGLVVAGDNLTLNLNGHTVSGDGVANANGFDVGVQVNGRNVKILGGSITAFDRGLVAVSSPGIRLSHLVVRNNTNRGMMVDQGSDGARIEHNDTSDNGASGIAIVESNGARVIDNRSMRNVGGAGVRLQTADGATVTDNRFDQNTFGVQIDPTANGNTVARNVMSGDIEAGVIINFSDDNVVTHNRMTGDGFGVTTESADRTIVTDNLVSHSDPTLCDGCGIGIQIYGNGSLVARNTVLDSPRYGIEVDDFQDPGHTPASGNVIRDNTVDQSGLGIAIGPEAAGVVLDTIIARNHVTHATGDGIQLIGPSTGLETSTLTKNVANRNGGFGIVAVPGTHDGGGNRAADNGNPAQCLNILCR
jgi:parallel beta-helix repeat protein